MRSVVKAIVRIRQIGVDIVANRSAGDNSMIRGSWRVSKILGSMYVSTSIVR